MTALELEYLDIDGEMIPHTVVAITGDGGCIFAAISFLLHGTEKYGVQIRHDVIRYVYTHWDQFDTASCNENGDNYRNAAEYLHDMSRNEAYGGYCELKAAAIQLSIRIDVFHQGKLLWSFGEGNSPWLRLRFSGEFSQGHFDAYLIGESSDVELLESLT